MSLTLNGKGRNFNESLHLEKTHSSQRICSDGFVPIFPRNLLALSLAMSLSLAGCSWLEA